jgi:5-(carboxyamino)imidazole ribonucleotide synthase
MTKKFMPGSTIGVLGGGQLGRMFAIAARKMGYRVHTFDPSPDSPMGQISDREYTADYADTSALKDFVSGVDVVTYEFENVPAETLDFCAERVTLRPGRQVLYIAQNRRREKEFLAKHGFPVAPFRVVVTSEQVEAGVEALKTPCVLKTADFGYDGKGQVKILSPEEGTLAWKTLAVPVGVLESWVSFELEFSLLIARGLEGAMEIFPISVNEHENHILTRCTVPCGLPERIQQEAAEIARALAEKLELVGLLAIEFFLGKDGRLVVNELAPRPHNSGHFTFDACVTSQFEQQLRAVCGLPLGETRLLQPVVMRNLLGDLWKLGTPDWEGLLRLPGLRLHLYGKSDPRPGRKMGHYCVLAETLEIASQRDAQAWALLNPKV